MKMPLTIPQKIQFCVGSSNSWKAVIICLEIKTEIPTTIANSITNQIQ